MDKLKMNQSQNKSITHLIRHQQAYLLALAALILIIPALINFFSGKPLIMGAESYYHLQQAKEIRAENFIYAPLAAVLLLIPVDLLFIFPLLLALISLFCFKKIIQETQRSSNPNSLAIIAVSSFA